MKSTLAILEKWKAKNTDASGKKPKLVIVSASGGGLRSALWTLTSLLHADSVSEGKLMDQTVLISGSSGGMIGASYVREILLREAEKIKKNNEKNVHPITCSGFVDDGL